ncbi:ATP-binding protein [uncultured Flavobacterium sp.]|uniref:ATP-binding protein n=1 Tax=uncultured Flavobacterium sp. TaxID=165435 RepID=UPI0025E5C4A8|nr:ATP-binding protein [uncultured Flavobacterium sp.]
MKNYLCAIAFMFINFSGLFAQVTDFVPALEVKTDTAYFERIPEKHWQYLDVKESLPFEKASSAQYTGFYKRGKEGITINNGCWMRYKVRNGLGKPLLFTVPAGMEGHVYFVRGSRIKHSASGFLMPWSQRDGLKGRAEVDYTLPIGEEVSVYVHFIKGNTQDLYPAIGFYDRIVGDYYAENDGQVTYGDTIFLAGFVLFAGLFNFLFYYLVRERVYFVYGLALVIISACFGHVLFFNTLSKEAPLAGLVLYYANYALGIALVLIVMAMFLRVDVYYPRLYKLFSVIAVLGCMSGFLAFLNPIFGFWDGFRLAANLLCALPAGFLVVTAIILTFRKSRAAYIFIIGVFPLLLLMFFDFAVVSTKYIAWLKDLQLGAAIWGIAVISWSLFQRFRHIMNENVQHSLENERLAREKEEERNALIAQQNEQLEIQVAERTTELSQSLSELKQTQNQLIQSEKMASLGELTAGIAHEIQNPLNFINNFSDVSIELLDEMGEELDKGDTEEAKAIAGDIKQNLEKIAHHGRRADGIVKGMLQHSRASSGQKEPTDINALADEYLRLAYHGLRAKDKSFNAELVMDFDENLPKVNAIPQDLGRVLLNLFTNAFYATQEKSKQSQSQFSVYKPVVTVTTKQSGNTVEVIVKDNGTGMPDGIKDKILQPFFTTKPTGEGTGLGLSLSYDIVVKGHGGTIDIESREGEGAEFTVTLPVGNP